MVKENRLFLSIRKILKTISLTPSFYVKETKIKAG